jgi:hypothetical protein
MGNMKNGIRTTQAGIIIVFVFISTLFSMVPITSAGIVFNLQSILNVSWSGQTDEPIVPRGELRSLTLVITHSIARGATGEAVLVSMAGSLIPIDVSVVDKPSWCTATISQGTLSVIVQPNQVSTVETTLTIQVDDNAPAYELGYIKIRASAHTVGLIEGFDDDFTLTFIPAYKALISPSYPETYSKEIGPMDTAVFPIVIENLGNARTIVYLKVVSVPKDWVALVTDQIILDEGAGSKGTAYLIIKPPKSFGYHNDEQTIKISMQPVKYDDSSQKGEITYQSFLVESRGFSTPGFDTLLLFSATALLILLLFIQKKNKK